MAKRKTEYEEQNRIKHLFRDQFQPKRSIPPLCSPVNQDDPLYQLRASHSSLQVFVCFARIFGLILLLVPFGFIVTSFRGCQQQRQFKRMEPPPERQAMRAVTPVEQPQITDTNPEFPLETQRTTRTTPRLPPLPPAPPAPVTEKRDPDILTVEEYEAWNKARMKYIEDYIIPNKLPVPFMEDLPPHLAPERFQKKP